MITRTLENLPQAARAKAWVAQGLDAGARRASEPLTLVRTEGGGAQCAA